MAVQETIRRLRVEATNSGVDELTKKLRELGDTAKDIRTRFDESMKTQEKAAGAQAAMAKAAQGLQLQLAALAGNLGLIGSVLSAFGPWGFAAAVALGAVAAGLKHVREESMRMGEAAEEAVKASKNMERLAEVTGFTEVQIRALRKTMEEFKVEDSTIDNALQRFSFQMNEARKRSGDLFNQVRDLDGELAKALIATKNNGEAITILGKAYDKAEDASKKAAIAAAAFGRLGIGLGPILGAVGEDGKGIDKLEKDTKKLSQATDEQNKRWADMHDKIKNMRKEAEDILASIFTEQGLAAELKAAEYMKSIALAAKDLAAQKEGLSWVQQLFIGLARGSDAGAVEALEKVNALFAARQRLAAGAGSAGVTTLSADPAAIKSWNDFAIAVGMVPKPLDDVKKKLEESEPKEKTHADLLAEATRRTNELAARMGALGSAATISEQLQAHLAKIEQERLSNIFSLNKAENDALANRARGAAVLDTVIQKESIRIGLLGNLASVNETVKKTEDEIRKAQQQGITFTDKEIEQIKERARVQAEAAKPENQIKTEREMIFLSDQEAAIRQKILGWGVDYNTVRGQELAQQLRINDAMKSLVTIAKDIGEQFAKGIVQNLMQGKNIMDSMVLSARSLSTTLASQAITEAFKGNVVGAAASGIGAIISGIFGSSQTSQEKQAAALRSQDLQLRAHGTDTNSLNDILAAFDLKAKEEVAGLTGGGFENKGGFLGFGGHQVKTNEAVQLEQAQAAERLRVIADFNQKAIDADQQAAADRLEADKQAEADRLKTIEDFGRALNDVQGKGFLNDFADLFKQIATFQAAGVDPAQLSQFKALSAQKIIDDAKLTGQAFDDLIRQFPELTGAVHEFTAEVIKTARSLDEIAAAQQSAQDRLFAATNDNTTLAGQLAAFDRQAARERADEASKGGQALVDLEAAQLAERGNIIKKFNQEAIEADRKAAQERIDAINRAAASVVDYLNRLVSGPGSTLSPQDTLTNAQAVYNANLLLAQGNPADQATIDAVNKFPEVADNLEKAARAVFGSAVGYQDIRNQIISQGLALPTVQAATDPLVIALRDNLQAIQDNTTGLDTSSTTIGTNTTSLTTTTTALTTNSGALGTTSTALTTNSGALGTTSTALTTTSSALGTNTTSLNNTNTAFGNNTTAVTSNTTAQGNATTALTTNSSALGSTSTALSNTTTALGDTSTAITNNSSAFGSNTTAITTNTTALGSTTTGVSNTMGPNGTISTFFGPQGALQTVMGPNGTYTVSLGQVNGNTASSATSLGTLTSLPQLTNGLNINMGNTAASTAYSAYLLDLVYQQVYASAVNNALMIQIWGQGGTAKSILDLIRTNTANTTNNLSGHFVNLFDGVATGGLIRGPGTGVSDSIPARLSNGEFVINARSTASNLSLLHAINDNVPLAVFGSGGGDNGALLAEVRRLNARIESLERTVAASAANSAQAIVESVAEHQEATERGTKKTTSAIELARRNQRAA